MRSFVLFVAFVAVSRAVMLEDDVEDDVDHADFAKVEATLVDNMPRHFCEPSVLIDELNVVCGPKNYHLEERVVGQPLSRDYTICCKTPCSRKTVRKLFCSKLFSVIQDVLSPRTKYV